MLFLTIERNGNASLVDEGERPLIASAIRSLLNPIVRLLVTLVGLALIIIAANIESEFLQSVIIDGGIIICLFLWLCDIELVRSKPLVIGMLGIVCLSLFVSYAFRHDHYWSAIGRTTGLVILFALLLDSWLVTLLNMLGSVAEQESRNFFEFDEGMATLAGDLLWLPRKDAVNPGLSELTDLGWNVSANSNSRWREITLWRKGYYINAVLDGERALRRGRPVKFWGYRNNDTSEFLSSLECRVILGRKLSDAVIQRIKELEVISKGPF